MKRVKLMLLSLLVLGIVGGALALKVKFDTDFCTTPVRIVDKLFVCTVANGAALKCPNLVAGVTTKAPSGANAWCTTTKPATGCNANLDCINKVVGLKAKK